MEDEIWSESSHPRKKSNLILRGLIMHRGGGILRCPDCGRVLARVHLDRQQNLFLHILCTCGHNGYLKKSFSYIENADGEADYYENIVSCPRCAAEFLWISSSVLNFALQTQCLCGEIFSRVRPRKRRLYQELLSSKNGLHNHALLDEDGKDSPQPRQSAPLSNVAAEKVLKSGQ